MTIVPFPKRAGAGDTRADPPSAVSEGGGEPVYRFGSFELDVAGCELRQDGRALPLTSTPLRLLQHLLENRDRVVGKHELLDTVWPGIIVGDAALWSALKEIRHALGDDGAQQRWIQTRRGQGYRFVGEVARALRPARSSEAGGTQRRPLYGDPPPRSAYFCGREGELQELERRLAESSEGGTWISIEGPPGAGKTELAVQLAFRLAHRGAFPGGVFWLDAAAGDLSPLWGVRIAEQLHLTGPTAEQRAAMAVRLLEELREPALIVLDNVESFTEAAGPHPLPVSPNLSLVATTRVRDLGGSRFRHLACGPLERSDAAALVHSIAGRDAGAEDEALLDHLGGHALALELAGSFLRTYPGETARSYLDAMSAGADLEPEVVERVRYGRTVEHALRAVWERLAPEVRDAWRMAACFDPAPASRELARHVGLDRRRLRLLEERHLVQTEADGAWTMHRLVSAFALAEEVSACADARHRFVLGCVALVRELGMGPGNELGRAYARDRLHLDAALRYASSDAVPSEDASPEDVELRVRIGMARIANGHRESGCALLREALEQTDAAVADPTHPSSSDGSVHLVLQRARALTLLGHTEMRPELLEAAVSAHRAALEAEPDTPNRSQQLHELATVLVVLGGITERTERLREAIDVCRSALELRPRAHDPAGFVHTQSVLGAALGQLGRQESSTEYMKQAIEAHRTGVDACAELDPERYRDVIATVRANLAAGLLELGMLSRSPDVLRAALDAYQSVLHETPREHAPWRWALVQSNTSTAWIELGACEGEVGHFEEAERAARNALLERRRERAPELWATSILALAGSLVGMSRLRPDASKLEEASELLTEALREAPPERSRILYASLEEELGTALAALADLRSDAEIRDAAARAYGRALEAIDPLHDSPRRARLESALAELRQHA